MFTVTLAELYAKQGLAGRARDILRKLADEGHEEARRRLGELGDGEGRAIALLTELLERVRERRQARS
jgi:lipopolysaccharide biosynthesis regulator YciM